MSAKRHRIAVIPGDGIGQEVIPAALTVLEKVASRSGFSFDLVEFPYGCAYYANTGRMMAADAFDRLADFRRFILAPSATRQCPTTSRFGSSSFRFGSASISTSTCGPCAYFRASIHRSRIAGRPTST